VVKKKARCDAKKAEVGPKTDGLRRKGREAAFRGGSFLCGPKKRNCGATSRGRTPRAGVPTGMQVKDPPRGEGRETG